MTTNNQAFEAMQAEINALKQDNAKLKASQETGHGCKVTEKGGLSVYGLGRFPVTLYLSQWEKLFAKIDLIKAFIEANKVALSDKRPAKTPATEQTQASAKSQAVDDIVDRDVDENAA